MTSVLVFTALSVMNVHLAAAESCGSGGCAKLCCQAMYTWDDTCNEPLGLCTDGLTKMAAEGFATGQAETAPCCNPSTLLIVLSSLLTLLCCGGMCYGCYRCCCAQAPGTTVVMSTATPYPNASVMLAAPPNSPPPPPLTGKDQGYC